MARWAKDDEVNEKQATLGLWQMLSAERVGRLRNSMVVQVKVKHTGCIRSGASTSSSCGSRLSYVQQVAAEGIYKRRMYGYEHEK